ncbi:MAG: hypothetical protein RLZ98_2096 [Pseudomonadota bacterium]|jgi:hypothetical protein
MNQFNVNVERIDPDTALRLWQDADEASVFTHPIILSALCHEVHWWLATEAGIPACIWPVCLDPNNQVCRPDFAYYLGPVQLGRQDPSPRRRLLQAVEVQHKLLDILIDTYGEVRWSTLPGERDLRPWLWFEKHGRHPIAQPRHTAWIEDLSRFKDKDGLVYFGRKRRQDYRTALEGGAVLLPEITIGRVKELYYETLEANNAADTALRRMDSVESLYEVAQEGHGFVLAGGLAQDMVPRAFCLVLIGKARANAVIAASDSLWRSKDFNPFLQFNLLMRANAENATLYDFNGANSLLLSSDKHSYGAEVKMYFDLHWR